MKAICSGVLVLTLVLSGACHTLDVPDFQASSLNDLLNNPSAAAIEAAVTGLLIASRTQNFTVQRGYVETAGVMGRESQSLDPSNSATNPSRVQQLTAAGGTTVWTNAYASIQAQNIVLQALGVATTLTDPQKEAIRGLVLTLQANDLLAVINLLDSSGAVIDVKSAPAAPPSPVVGKAAVFTRIVQLLDQAATHLQNGGTTFPMPLSTGYTGFTNPSTTFLQFNRALRARVAVYLGDYAGALTYLQQSFLSLTQPLTLGVYHAFTTNPGDASNPYFDPLPRVIFAHTSQLADAQLKGDGTKDARVLAKVVPITPKLQLGYPVDAKYIIYSSGAAPISIVRNEELILLRAEANIGLGNNSTAITDINFIRVNSGGLQPISDPYVPAAGQPATLLDELLYEKRYSLLFEGHRWVDLRRYGKLATLPKTLPTDKIFPWFPLPDAECLARTPPPPGCAVPAGF